MRLWITLQPENGEEMFGAFKANTRASFGALLRLLGHDVSLHHPPRSFELPPRDGLREFFGGTSDRLIAEAAPLNPSAFAQTLFQHDQELVTRFFHSGPRRNRRICEKHGLTRIPQERLDDLIALG